MEEKFAILAKAYREQMAINRAQQELLRSLRVEVNELQKLVEKIATGCKN